MPIFITTYRCKYCGTEYKNLDDAVQCENLGIPERAHRVGDLIALNLYVPVERVSGTIVLKIIERVDIDGSFSHVWRYFIRSSSWEYAAWHTETEKLDQVDSDINTYNVFRGLRQLPGTIEDLITNAKEIGLYLESTNFTNIV